MLTGQAKTDYMKFYMRRRRATFTIPGRIQTITELLAQSGHHKPNKEKLRLELAFWEAQRNIDWILTNTKDPDMIRGWLDSTIDEVYGEVGNRGLPYHGRAHNGFPQWTGKQLDEMLRVYSEFRNTIRKGRDEEKIEGHDLVGTKRGI